MAHDAAAAAVAADEVAVDVAVAVDAGDAGRCDHLWGQDTSLLAGPTVTGLCSNY